MKLTQGVANLLLALAVFGSALYAEGIIAGKWAGLLYAALIGLKFFLVNAGYPRLPNGEMLPPAVRDLPAGSTINFVDRSKWGNGIPANQLTEEHPAHSNPNGSPPS